MYEILALLVKILGSVWLLFVVGWGFFPNGVKDFRHGGATVRNVASWATIAVGFAVTLIGIWV